MLKGGEEERGGNDIGVCIVFKGGGGAKGITGVYIVCKGWNDTVSMTRQCTISFLHWKILERVLCNGDTPAQNETTLWDSLCRMKLPPKIPCAE